MFAKVLSPSVAGPITFPGKPPHSADSHNLARYKLISFILVFDLPVHVHCHSSVSVFWGSSNELNGKKVTILGEDKANFRMLLELLHEGNKLCFEVRLAS